MCFYSYRYRNIQDHKDVSNVLLETNQTTFSGRNQFAKPTKTECKPHTNIVFYKTHKCGSSTVQNIFLRFGDKNNLTFAMPVKNTFGYDHIFSLSIPFNSSMVEKLPSNEYNILAHHCVYNKTGFKAIMPSDSFYVTIIREPVSVFHSRFEYFHWDRQLDLLNYSNPIDEFMNRIAAFDRHDWSRYIKRTNVMFRNFDYKQKIDTTTMAKMVMANMEEELDFVMLLEYLDESLILLKNKLCWSFEDILYVPKLVLKQRFAINESLANRIRKWSRWDVILYDRFNTSFWKQVNKFGLHKMKRELHIFKDKQDDLVKNCSEEVQLNGSMKKNGLCWRVWQEERIYTKYLRNKQLTRYNKTFQQT
ncbi:galactosylceramide sulfotransferase-like [Antedon mediterranea]|uniref:galactosylceramide sulfotransferase-like n=1 Tax=Antedon mediterranea TaxID=105859 RepID=UPI003AF4555E